MHSPGLQHGPEHARIARDIRRIAAPRQICALAGPNERGADAQQRAGRVQQPRLRPQERYHERQIGERSDDHGAARSAQRQRRWRQPIADGQAAVDNGQTGVAIAVEVRVIGGDAIDDGFLCGRVTIL